MHGKYFFHQKFTEYILMKAMIKNKWNQIKYGWFNPSLRRLHKVVSTKKITKTIFILNFQNQNI